MGFNLTACGGDDGGSDGSVNYTSEEIIKMLTGKWEVYGHAKGTSSNTDIYENFEGDYTGTIEFTEGQKAKTYSSVISEVKGKNLDGGYYTDKITLAYFISDYYKYKITRKNGATYIAFGPDINPNEYKIVSLTKTSFKLVLNKDFKYKEEPMGDFTIHVELTVISQ